MAAPIDFYFDFSSPYGYFGATRISTLAKKYGRTVSWRPTLLGAVFKITGSGPLPTLPLKGPYSKRDMLRTARYLDIPFNFPDPFPISTQAPARAVRGPEPFEVFAEVQVPPELEAIRVEDAPEQAGVPRGEQGLDAGLRL